MNHYDMLSCQLKMIKMRAELTNLNICAVPFLSRAAVNLCWYDISEIRSYWPLLIIT